jgi:hypothetical protein
MFIMCLFHLFRKIRIQVSLSTVRSGTALASSLKDRSAYAQYTDTRNVARHIGEELIPLDRPLPPRGTSSATTSFGCKLCDPTVRLR